MASSIKGKKTSVYRKVMWAFTLLIMLCGTAMAYELYSMIYAPRVSLGDKDTDYLYIPSNSSFEDVIKLLYQRELISDQTSFKYLASWKNYKEVHSGKYMIKKGMSHNDLVNLLRSGVQEPIKVIINNIRTVEELAGKVAKQLEADSTSIVSLLKDAKYLNKINVKKIEVLALFIPNTYQIYWDTSAKEFIERMQGEHKCFWTSDRTDKAEKAGLTKVEVAVLASIVQKETSKKDEKPRVAGVYMNRLDKGMKLQADPTLIYALGDFLIKRVLNKHKLIDSPYNTYMYAGLPPGPICLSEISSIDAVLNYESHSYIYFCAKEDFSGYHNFAKTYAQHLLNARRYQRELNKRKILS
ncbi:MAG: endolytic transglycosylase MltG [Flavobacteriales bacterium]|nr:endolytic transglycosylase MltG [Flavobacteriales bacterium]